MTQTPESTKPLTAEAQTELYKITELGNKIQKAGKNPILICEAIEIKGEELTAVTFQKMTRDVKRTAHSDNYIAIKKVNLDFERQALPHFQVINNAIEILEKWVKEGKPTPTNSMSYESPSDTVYNNIKKELNAEKKAKYLKAVEKYTSEISLLAFQDAELIYGEVGIRKLENQKSEVIQSLERDFRRKKIRDVENAVMQVLTNSANPFSYSENSLRGKKGSEEFRIWKMYMEVQAGRFDHVYFVSFKENESKINQIGFNHNYNIFDPFDSLNYPKPDARQIYQEAFDKRAKELVSSRENAIQKYKWYFSASRKFSLFPQITA